MSTITIFYQNLAGNMGDGWRDEYTAALAYAAHLRTALCDYAQAVYPDAEIEVRITTERASGASRGLQVFSEFDGTEARDLEEALGDVANRAWETFCCSDTAQALYADEA